MKVSMAIAALLLAASGAFSRASAQAPDGKALYNESCRKCHGVIGTPPKTMKAKYPKIASFDSAFVAKHSADSVVKVLVHGKGEDMKSFKDKLTPEQMMAVARYVQELGMKRYPGS